MEAQEHFRRKPLGANLASEHFPKVKLEMVDEVLSDVADDRAKRADKIFLLFVQHSKMVSKDIQVVEASLAKRTFS